VPAWQYCWGSACWQLLPACNDCWSCCEPRELPAAAASYRGGHGRLNAGGLGSPYRLTIAHIANRLRASAQLLLCITWAALTVTCCICAMCRALSRRGRGRHARDEDDEDAELLQDEENDGGSNQARSGGMHCRHSMQNGLWWAVLCAESHQIFYKPALPRGGAL
jgi:hypothetical protein